jgi:hypothetical protein
MRPAGPSPRLRFADGTITRSGTAALWAAVDSANSRLLARGLVNVAKSVEGGGSFPLPSFTIRMPGQ